MPQVGEAIKIEGTLEDDDATKFLRGTVFKDDGTVHAGPVDVAQQRRWRRREGLVRKEIAGRSDNKFV